MTAESHETARATSAVIAFPMKVRSIRITSAMFFVALTAVTSVEAQTKPKDKAGSGQLATEVFGEAQKLFDKGKYAEALVGFRQAYNASNSPNARLMVGNCLIALGKNSEAYAEMAETLQDATARAATEPKYAKTRDSASAQLTLLEGKVGKVIVQIEERGAEVTVNGTRVAPDKLGTAIAVDPGTVTIAAKHIDGRTVFQERAVAAGKTEKVELVFAPLNGPEKLKKDESNIVDKGLPKDTDTTTPASKGGGVRIAGGVVLGLGVAGMALFGITGSMAKSRFATLETECGGARCTDPKYGDVIDSGKTLTTVANVGLGVGAAGIVVGSLMVILGGPSKPAASPVAMVVSPTGAYFQYRMAL